MKVTMLPILKDNYAYMIEGTDGETGVLDPGEAEPVIEYLERNSLTLHTIFCTHHHGDHIAGVAELATRYRCRVIGPEKDTHRIAGITVPVHEGNIVTFGAEPVRVIETPGHTSGHVCYYAPQSKALFAGDTLFSMGCGRLFEGTPEEMFSSLKKLSCLPDDTMVYCGHEYTLSNAAFCLSQYPDNQDLIRRHEEVKALRALGRPTLPVSLETEKSTNCFLRVKDAAAFAVLRKRKDAA